ncbi:hypothetical protein J8J27_28725, partial [Mycobacterium tuberculosis]|nr:hypothetical protein [Mycobacterium tuberculosis]
VPSKLETKSDATTRAARAIIDLEVAAREAKTERLRAARLARDAAAAPSEKPRSSRAKRG